MEELPKDRVYQPLLKNCLVAARIVLIWLLPLCAAIGQHMLPPPPPPPPPPTLKKEEIFKYLVHMPRFPGCEDEPTKTRKDSCAREKMMTFLYKSIQVPEAARQKGITGKVVANFLVNLDGSISNVNIIRNIGGGCGAEVARVIESMNTCGIRFTPMGSRGRVGRVRFQVEIEFTKEMLEKP